MNLKKKILAKLTVFVFSLTLFSNIVPNVAYADTIGKGGSQHFSVDLKINGKVISDGATIELKNGEPVDFRLDFKCAPNVQEGDKLTFTLPSAFKDMKLLRYPTVCFDKPIINGNTVTFVANKNITSGILGGYLYLKATFNSTNSSGKITVPIDVNGINKNVTITYNPPTSISIDKTVNKKKTLGLNMNQVGETLHYKVVVDDKDQTVKLPFVDQMQPGIDLNADSIKIVNSSGQDITSQIKDTMKIIKGESGTKIEIPNFPLEGKYTLTYDATVNKEMAQGKDVWARTNTATMGKADSTATVIVNADGGKTLTPDAKSKLTKKTVYGDTYNKVGEIKQYTLTINSEHYEIPTGITMTDKLPEGLTFTDDGTSGLSAWLNSPYDGGTTPPITVYLISSTGEKTVISSEGANPGVEVTLNQQNKTITVKTLQKMNSKITVQYNTKIDKKLDSITNTVGTIIDGHNYDTSATIKYVAPETASINKTANEVKNAIIRVSAMNYPINYAISVDTTNMTTPKNFVDNMQTGLKLLPDTIKIVNTKTNKDITESLKNSITTSTNSNGTVITIKNFPVGGTYNITYQAKPEQTDKSAWVRKNTATLGNANSEASVTLNSDLGNTVTPDQVKNLTSKTLINGETYNNIGSILRYKVTMNNQNYQLPVGTKIVDKFPSELTFPDVKGMNITTLCSGPNGQFAPGQLNTYWINKDGSKQLIQKYPNVIGTITFDSRNNTITLEVTRSTNSSYEFEYNAKVAQIAASITNTLQTQVGENTAKSSATANFKADAGLIGAKKTVNKTTLTHGENEDVQYGIDITSWGAFPKGYLNIVDNINPLLKITGVQVPEGFTYKIDGNKVEIKNNQTVVGTMENPLSYQVKINTSFDNVKDGTTIDNTAYVDNFPTNKVVTKKGYAFTAVKKANENHSKLLEGAVYGVYNKTDNSLLYEVTSNKEGVLEGAINKPGEYYLKEIKAPIGYTVSDQKTDFTITSSNLGTIVELPILYDNLIPGNISITKENSNGDKLAGAKFNVVQNGTVIQSGVTNKKGELNFKDIPQGEYQIIEVEAPNGYEIAKTENITVETNKTTPVKIIDKKINGSLKVEKIAEDGKSLADATFKITGPNGYDKSLTTDSTGIISLNNLDWGTYTVKETVAPPGYELDKTVHTVDINSDNAKTGVLLVVKDKIILGQLQIIKTDATSNKALAGATFKITGPNGYNKTVTTDKDGQVNLNNLAWGKYTVIETVAPNGYNLDKTPQQITVRNTSVGKVQVAKFVDSRILGNIKITKTNEKGQNLQGAEFTITKPDGTKVKVKTNDKGIAELSGLAWGDYTVQETVAPQGYELDNTVYKIVIDNNNANIVQNLNVVDGAKTGTIEVTKLGKDGIKLEGAQFTVEGPNNFSQIITTNSSGIAEATGLPWGTYTIKETKAPKGYTLSNEVSTVNITKENVETVQNVTVNDIQILGKIQVIKTGNTGEKLANAEFMVKGPNGFDKTITTDKNGVASLDNLAWGDYTVKETKAPAGYTLNSIVQKVTIGADNVENIQSVNVVDTQILGQLQIVKTDATSNKVLAGTTFKITGPNGYDKTVITDKDGQVNLNNLAWGKYTIIETAAPNGYNLDKTPQQIVISNTSVGKVQVVKFADSRILGSIKITKTNEKGQTLQGAEFTITKPDGTKVKVKTNDKGITELSGLAWGDYTVQETVAPQGYELDNTVHKIIIDNNNANIVQSLNIVDRAKTGSIKITKFGKDGVKLEGAQFTVEGPSNFTQNITTNINGVAEVTGLPWGTYTIKETKAPVGYELNSTVQKVTIGADNVENIQSVNVVDTQILGQLQIVKTDATSNKALAGATFNVKGPNGYDKTVTTDKNGQVNLNSLQWGTYTIKEIKAPVGYNLDGKESKVVVNNTSVGKVQQVTIKDTLITGTVKLSKIDITNGKEVAGAKIVIKGTSLTGEKIGKIFISKDTATEFTLPAGTYTYTEVSPPVGYLINKTTNTFTISKQGQVIIAQVKDERILGRVEVIKTNENGTPLEGATFNVSGPNGFNKNITTNKDGIANLNNLVWGNYTIKEIKAPNGYKINNNKAIVTISSTNAEITQKVTVIDQKIPVISKGESNSNKDNHSVDKGQAPSTGDSSLFMVYTILGMSVVILLVLNLEIKRKKRKR